MTNPKEQKQRVRSFISEVNLSRKKQQLCQLLTDYLVKLDAFESIDRQMRHIVDAGGQPYVIGGCLRDLVLLGPGCQPKDIDIVVDGIPRLSGICTTFDTVGINSFGGYKIEEEGTHFDLWTVHQSAQLQGYTVETRTIRCFVHSVLLNVQAIAVSWPVGGSVPQAKDVVDAGFFDAITSGVTALQFAWFLDEASSFQRILKLILNTKCRIGPRLQEFLRGQLSNQFLHRDIHSEETRATLEQLYHDLCLPHKEPYHPKVLWD